MHWAIIFRCDGIRVHRRDDGAVGVFDSDLAGGIEDILDDVLRGGDLGGRGVGHIEEGLGWLTVLGVRQGGCGEDEGDYGGEKVEEGGGV